MLTSSALLLSASLGAVAAGMPLLYLAAPLVGAGGLALFLQSRKLADYCIFVMGGVFTAAWFIHHHFWFLEVDIAVSDAVRTSFQSLLFRKKFFIEQWLECE